jgi:class 3 adenylate cyclase
MERGLAAMFNRFGIRGHLLLAFLGINGLALLATAAALYTFHQVGEVIEQTGGHRVPSALIALRLSKQVERVASTGSDVFTATTKAKHDEARATSQAEMGDLGQLLRMLKSSTLRTDAINEIEALVNDLRSNLSALEKLGSSHLAVIGRKDELIRGLSDTTTATVGEFKANSIIAEHQNDLAVAAQGDKLLDENKRLSRALGFAVNRLTMAANVEIIQAGREVAAVHRLGTSVLLVTAFLGLLTSVLIVWLYVDRNIVARLTALGASMLAIAGGNLKTSLPEGGGKDEIGRMADALRIFRDKVVENERLGRLKSFLAPQVAELIVTSGDESVLDSHRRDVAVLFCDLRGFTAFAENSEPEEIMEFLREYHESLGRLVDKYAGTLERFTGDGLIVLFNDPLPSPDPCLAAARLAVEMRADVNEVIRRRQLGNRLGFGIGIAYGYATLGRVGFKGRFDYTAIGSVVNLAARLCERAQANKILVDSKVHAAVEGDMETEALGEFLPKGFSKPIEVFNIAAQQIILD